MLCWLLHASTTLSRIAASIRDDAQLQLKEESQHRINGGAAASDGACEGGSNDDDHGGGDSVCVSGGKGRLEELEALSAHHSAEHERYLAVTKELKQSLLAVHWSDDDELFLDTGVTYTMP